MLSRGLRTQAQRQEGVSAPSVLSKPAKAKHRNETWLSEGLLVPVNLPKSAPSLASPLPPLWLIIYLDRNLDTPPWHPDTSDASGALQIIS